MRRGRVSAGMAAVVALLALPPAAGTETRPAPARIAYVSNGDIHTIGADGSDRRLVAREAEGPTWSPDGASLAFVRPAGDASRIFVTSRDGSGARSITKPGRAVDANPAWSPDGGRVAFIRRRVSGEFTLVTTLMSVPAGGGTPRRIAQIASKREVGFDSIDWSPDGARILATVASQDDEQDGESTLQVVDVASGKRTRIVRTAGWGSWSPTGDRIAYARIPRTCEEYPCSDLYVANADGSGARRITSLANRGGYLGTSWSADGERIAFASDRNYPAGGSYELYSIRPDGSCLTWLTNGTAFVYGPQFEPVGGPPTDPGGCGAVPREPLIEVDNSEIAAYRDAPIWWLGTRFGNLLLSYTEQESGAADVSYDDCASFEPSECPEPIELSQYPTCDYSTGYYEDGSDLSLRAGVLVYSEEFLDLETSPLALIGPTAMYVDAGRRLDEVLGALRPFPQETRPEGALPRAELPNGLWRSLERIRAAVRKYGVTGAARRLKTSRARIKRSVALDRRLRELGPFGRTGCR